MLYSAFSDIVCCIVEQLKVVMLLGCVSIVPNFPRESRGQSSATPLGEFEDLGVQTFIRKEMVSRGASSSLQDTKYLDSTGMKVYICGRSVRLKNCLAGSKLYL